MGVMPQSSKPHMDGIRRFMRLHKPEAVRARFETSYKKIGFPRIPFLKNTKVKIGLITLGAGIIVLWVGGIIAQAEIARFYPAQCSGEWENVQAAAEAPQLNNPSDPAEFTLANSAVLLGGKKIITCENFAGDVVPEKILRAKLNLSWVFKPKTVPTAGPEPIISAPVEPITTPAEEPATSTPDTITTPTPETQTTPQTELQPQAPVSPEIPVSPEVPVVAPSPTTFRFLPILSAQAQENASAGVPTVSASLIFNGIENFLDVEYSLDGLQWESVNNGDLEIPLVSMDDLKNVKLRLVSLRDDARLPDVYLDALWLEVKYVPQESTGPGDEATSTSVLDTVTSALGDIPSTLSDAVQSGADAIADLFTNPQVEVTNSPQTVDSTPKQPEIKTITVRRFSLNPAKETGTGAVTVERGGEAVRISGACTEPYVTLLLFRSEEDITTDPARAIVNHAYPCTGKDFSLLLEDFMIPSTLPDGSYILFTAGQKSTEAWHASGPKHSVTVQTITVTIP